VVLLVLLVAALLMGPTLHSFVRERTHKVLQTHFASTVEFSDFDVTMFPRLRVTITEMTEEQIDLCGKCGAEIDPSRRVDFTPKDGTRVCDACFVRETPRQTLLKNGWSN
jgi:hypothetical protein